MSLYNTVVTMLVGLTFAHNVYSTSLEEIKSRYLARKQNRDLINSYSTSPTKTSEKSLDHLIKENDFKLENPENRLNLIPFIQNLDNNINNINTNVDNDVDINNNTTNNNDTNNNDLNNIVNQFHIVQRGESYCSISNKYDIGINTLKLINKYHKTLKIGEHVFFNPEVIHNETESYIWPFDSHDRITSPYGYRTDPVSKMKYGRNKRKFHNGIDIAAPVGTNIKSVCSGSVLYSGRRGTAGNAVIIESFGDGNIYQSLYFHLNKCIVKQGEYVEQGQVIGKSGKTGRVTGPHLHLGFKKNNKYFDPMKFYKSKSNNNIAKISNNYKNQGSGR